MINTKSNAILLFLLRSSLLLLLLRLESIKTLNVNTCQSGLREDNTNYIYCARQGLDRIPNFFSNSAQQSTGNVQNVVYDELVLSDNQIASIDANSFTNSLKVRKLYLDLNPIRFIDHTSFNHIRNYLEELYFEQKFLTPIKSQPPTLDDYYIENVNEHSSNDLAIFEQPIIKTCFNLRLFSLKKYEIKHLTENLFVKLNKLDKLELVGLSLASIDDGAFNGLESSLTELNLDSNNLENVPSESLVNLKRLKKLTLSQNRIKTLQANGFFKFSSLLHTLDLSYNHLAEVSPDAFNGPVQNSLKSVRIQNNELKWSHFINLLFNLRQLQDLNVDFNKLSVVDFDFSGQIYDGHNDTNLRLSLVSLSLQGNGLDARTLEAFLAVYTGLGLELSHLNGRRLKFDQLTRLNLARNKITHLPEDFFLKLNMSKVRSLLLDRNLLDASSFGVRSFTGLGQSLESLSVNNAALDFLAPGFLKSLTILQALKSLKLNGNTSPDRESLSSSFTLKQLNSLELQNNNLARLPTFLCNFENLTDVDLSSNQIESFSLTCLLQRNGTKTKLKHLNLNNNPLRCDCGMKELKFWLMKNYDKDLLDLIRWKCASPVEMNGRELNRISYYDLKCHNLTSTPILTSEITASDTSIILVHGEDLRPLAVSTSTETSSTMVQTSQKMLLKPEQMPSADFYSPNDNRKLFSWLIVGISLGISTMSLLIMIILYLMCLRSPKLVKKDSTFDYVNEFLNRLDDKYEQGQCFSSSFSSTVSPSICKSISAYTASTSMNSSKDFLNSMISLVNPSGTDSQRYAKNSPEQFKPIVKTTMLPSLYSIESPTLTDPTHIYHEINTAGSSAPDSKVNPDTSCYYYKDNLNYLNMDCLTKSVQQSPSIESHYNSLCFYNNNNTNSSSINFAHSNSRNNLHLHGEYNNFKLNSLNEGLIV